MFDEVVNLCFNTYSIMVSHFLWNHQIGLLAPVILHMHDIPLAAKALNGVKMELVDAAFPLLKGVIATTDVVDGCTRVTIVVMVGGFPRKEGMERIDVITKYVSIYKSQASTLGSMLLPTARLMKFSISLNFLDGIGMLVLVVANLANTNALILKEFAPSILKRNITCLTRLDHNIMLKNVIIWGNHSATQYPDVSRATCKCKEQFIVGEFITIVKQRGAAIIGAQKLSSALSAASSVCDHIHDWVLGTPEEIWVSMDVYSDGSYNVPVGLFYSFPVTCRNGEWTIVEGTVKKLVYSIFWSCLN
ncbi:hypothetical protein UlMin_011162 [Ulmus minor]